MKLIQCDMEGSVALHGTLVTAGNELFVYSSRFQCAASGAKHTNFNNGIAIDSLFIDGGTAWPMGLNSSSVTVGCTFYNNTKAIEMPNSLLTRPPIIINCHVTDCTEFIDMLHSGTADNVAIEVFNRTRDNTTPRTGVGDGLLVGEVTTDTGGDTTDFTNPSSDDFSLISGAPGEDAAVGLDG